MLEHEEPLLPSGGAFSGSALRCARIEFTDAFTGQRRDFENKYICFTNKRTLILDASAFAMRGDADADADYTSKLLNDVNTSHYQRFAQRESSKLPKNRMERHIRYANQSREEEARKTLGLSLEWEEFPAPTSASPAHQLRSAKLAEAIKGGQTSFTQEENASFGLRGLSVRSIVEVDGRWYRPKPSSLLGAPAEAWESSAQALIADTYSFEVLSDSQGHYFTLEPGSVKEVKMDFTHYSGSVLSSPTSEAGASGGVALDVKHVTSRVLRIDLHPPAYSQATSVAQRAGARLQLFPAEEEPVQRAAALLAAIQPLMALSSDNQILAPFAGRMRGVGGPAAKAHQRREELTSLAHELGAVDDALSTQLTTVYDTAMKAATQWEESLARCREEIRVHTEAVLFCDVSEGIDESRENVAKLRAEEMQQKEVDAFAEELKLLRALTQQERAFGSKWDKAVEHIEGEIAALKRRLKLVQTEAPAPAPAPEPSDPTPMRGLFYDLMSPFREGSENEDPVQWVKAWDTEQPASAAQLEGGPQAEATKAATDMTWAITVTGQAATTAELPAAAVAEPASAPAMSSVAPQLAEVLAEALAKAEATAKAAEEAKAKVEAEGKVALEAMREKMVAAKKAAALEREAASRAKAEAEALAKQDEAAMAKAIAEKQAAHAAKLQAVIAEVRRAGRVTKPSVEEDTAFEASEAAVETEAKRKTPEANKTPAASKTPATDVKKKKVLLAFAMGKGKTSSKGEGTLAPAASAPATSPPEMPLPPSVEASVAVAGEGAGSVVALASSRLPAGPAP